MSKKILFLTTFALLLSLANSALAANVAWDNNNGTGDRLWQTATNWDIDKVPEAPDWVILDDTYTDDGNGPIINADTNAVCDWLGMGYNAAPYEEVVLTMTGGTLTVGGSFDMSWNYAGNYRFDISDGNVTTGGDFTVANWNYGTIGVVNMTGGTIAVGEDIEIGADQDSDCYGIFNMSDGRIDIVNEEQIYVGFYSTNPSIFNMTGGEVHTYEFVIGNNWGDTPAGAGHLKLHGGTIYAEYFAIGGEGNSSIDITDGVLIADEDLTVPNGYMFNPGVDDHEDAASWTGTIPILISKGIITAYDVNHGEIITDEVNYPAQAGLRAIVKVDYDVTNADKTTLSAMTCDPNLAWNEKPSSGSTRQLQIITLNWSPGLNAASHDVYFGTSFDDVNNGTGGTFIDNRDTNSYSPGESLILDTTYYWRIDEVNASGLPEWKGIIWNFRVAPGAATSPSPADGASDVLPATDLSWTPGIEAVSHELYFSTDFNDVNDRLIFPATPGANSYSPGALKFTTTYYWAVDEINNLADVNVWPGEVWSFTTTDHLVVDDFDSYTKFNLKDVWDDYYTNDTGAEIYLEWDADFVYEGNSIMYEYDSTWGTGVNYSGSRIDADTANLEIGSDWTAGGAKVLRLYFLGQADNSTTENDRMWVELEDTGSNTGVAIYDGDPNDVKEESWQEWNIDLGIFDACGVVLSNVSKVHIGFGGPQGGQTKTPGGKGTVWFDSIEVWPPYCRTELVTADVTGDCITNTDDLELLAADWLLYDYNFIAAEPCEANLIGWWKFDEGMGTITVDSSIYDNDGNIIEAAWRTGYPGDPCDSALHFDGDGVVTVDHVVCAQRDGNSPGTYPAELMPDKFTVTCWTKLDSFEYFSSFVTNGIDTSADECGFFFYNHGWNYPDWPVENFGLAIRTETDMYYVETPDIYKIKTWYHVAATYDGNYASVYVDGQLAAGPEDVGGPIRWISEDSNNYPENFVIGAWLDVGYELYVNGAIDDVRYYNVPLSQGDIAVLGAGITPGTELYQPVPSLANIIDPEPALSRKVNFMDYCILADNWLVGPVYWPSP